MKINNKVVHKCKYCLKIFSNKEYMKHLAKDHDDEQAKQILEELKDFHD